MKQFLIYSTIISFILLVSTYASLSLFGMNDQMDHSTNIECVTHCLSSVSPVTNSPSILLFGFVVVFNFLSVARFKTHLSTQRSRQRWRQALQPFLLHQKLSTVVILD